MTVAVAVAAQKQQASNSAATQPSILRTAQRSWSATSLRQRLKCVKRFRSALASNGVLLSSLYPSSLGRATADTLSTELIPLAEAARFLELRAVRLLRPQNLSNEGRPTWLRSVDITVRREPHGIVLVIAPANYPLFLPAVQVLQAVVAGNAVVWKPGKGGEALAKAICRLLIDAGVPCDLLLPTDESTEAGRQWIAAGVDKVVLTGSASSGRSVLEQCSASATPAAVELSGCDAFFVLPGADIAKAVRALAFGLTLNGGATCIAPRRIFAQAQIADDFFFALAAAIRNLPPIAMGAANANRVVDLLEDAVARGGSPLVPFDRIASTGMRPLVITGARPSMKVMNTDIFAPIAAAMTVQSMRDAVDAANACPYALGASIFGSLENARALAASVHAGVVTINDIIVPTADPRLSFGGRKASGFGKTRGAEGLLEMTVSKSIVVQRARRLRHLEAPHPQAADLFDGYLRMRHGGGLTQRLCGALDLCRAIAGKNRN